MGKMIYNCDFCGKEILRYPCQTKGRKKIFCSKLCMDKFSSKAYNPEGYNYKDFSKNSARFSAMNILLNPTRMTDETRKRIRLKKLGTGLCRSYEKTYGRHTHRIVAEQILGRDLLPGEVVHHIDGNKRNNEQSNLRIFASQDEHALHHKREEAFFRIYETFEEVMPL